MIQSEMYLCCLSTIMFGLAHDSMQGTMRDGCDKVYRRHTRYVDPSPQVQFCIEG